MDIKEGLIKIVGKENCFDNREVLEAYSRDYSLSPAGMPNYVVKPKDVQEISEVVKLANEHLIPVIPASSGVHFHGSTIPKQGGIVLDLSRMNKILEIDEASRKVMVEPGVIWSQFQEELAKHELMMVSPLLPHPSRSVLTTWLERELPLIPKYEYGDPLLAMEVVWPNGDIFRTGSASVPGFPESHAEGAHPGGPGGVDFYRLFQCAQGTMAVVAWTNIKVEYLPKLNKTFFVPFDKVEESVEFIHRIQKQRIGLECFLLNALNLSLILSEEWGDFQKLKEGLPPWTLIFILSGGRRRPEEKIAYEEEVLREIRNVEFPSIELWSTLPGISGIERKLPGILRRPWTDGTTYWKFRCKGSSEDLFFITPLERVPEFNEAITEVTGTLGYPADAIGQYVQPIEYGAGCHYEINFYYNKDNPAEVEQVKKVYAQTAEVLLDMRALFTRPYGILSDMVYQRTADYTAMLKKVKNLFDPNNIMCPGNLCF